VIVPDAAPTCIPPPPPLRLTASLFPPPTNTPDSRIARRIDAHRASVSSRRLRSARIRSPSSRSNFSAVVAYVIPPARPRRKLPSGFPFKQWKNSPPPPPVHPAEPSHSPDPPSPPARIHVVPSAA